MVLDAESMYCAEQINIPDNLGEILKAYSKEVIRQQPINIYEFSARYFAQLDQQEDDLLDEGIEGLPRDMVFSMVAECNEFARDDLEHSKLRELCEAADVPHQAMVNALGLMDLAEEEERVQWKQFVVALCTQVSGIEDVTAFVKLLMDPLMFGNDDGLIAKAEFMTLFDWWSTVDPSIGAELKLTLYENLEAGADFVGYTQPPPLPLLPRVCMSIYVYM